MKLDLHTHCYEATVFDKLTEKVVALFVERIKAQGLDGIAITDHDYKLQEMDVNYAFKVQEIASRLYPEVLIIPGQEIYSNSQEVVELYLPGNKVFRFLAHPGYPGSFTADFTPDNLQGIEIRNSLHNWHIPQDLVREMAERYDLLLLTNSDAHTLRDIGNAHNEIDWETLCARAKPRDASSHSPW